MVAENNELVLVRPEIADIESIIDGVIDADSAKTASGNMDKLKKLLEVADQYGEFASQYCLAEARLYIKIASIEGADEQLPRSKQDIIGWIRTKTQDELDEIMETVREGTRIGTIKNREIRTKIDAMRAKGIISEYKRISNEIIEEYKGVGSVNVSVARFYDKWTFPDAPDRETAKAYADKTRNDVLSAGGVGIADGVGTYIDPSSANRQTISAAVGNRLESIYRDLCALASICEKANFSIPENGVALLKEAFARIEAI